MYNGIVHAGKKILYTLWKSTIEVAVPAAAAQVLLLNALHYTDCELAVDKGWNYLLGNLVATITLFLCSTSVRSLPLYTR